MEPRRLFPHMEELQEQPLHIPPGFVLVPEHALTLATPPPNSVAMPTAPLLPYASSVMPLSYSFSAPVPAVRTSPLLPLLYKILLGTQLSTPQHQVGTRTTYYTITERL